MAMATSGVALGTTSALVDHLPPCSASSSAFACGLGRSVVPTSLQRPAGLLLASSADDAASLSPSGGLCKVSAALCLGVTAFSAASRRARRRGDGGHVKRRVLQPFVIEPINTFMTDMKEMAKRLATPGRVVLDASEGPKELQQRLKLAGASGGGAAEDRAEWRRLLASGALRDLCSGVVLDEEGLAQEGVVKALQDQGVAVGVRVDEGFFPMNGYGEIGTEGLVDLERRVQGCYQKGARFAKWRTRLKLNMELPTDIVVWENTFRLAECARHCQMNGLVTLIEIELESGNQDKHSLDRASYVLEKVMSQTIRQLNEQDVAVEAIVLVPPTLSAGIGAPPASTESNVRATLRTLLRTAPPAVGGILALPGDRGSLKESARILRELQESNTGPWPIVPIYGPLLLGPILETWIASGTDAAHQLLARLLGASVATQVVAQE
mmetsp:Transcript_127932/g.409860  ORF Transcript_127932/g.409860 Transcript_127932/m.409860 type:complete len:439 (+) Transcript_127932:98-1414(+)